MFCVQLEGSHTCCRQKGESAGYQARKKAVTTNSIFLCDNKEQMIVMGSPKAGNHNDLYKIEEVLKEILVLLDNPRNREQPYVYFDEELYKNRFKIERANSWIDGYKGLIMRYEYLDVTWIGMLLLGFISKFLKKV